MNGMDKMHPKEFAALALDGKVAVATREYEPQADEHAPGTRVQLAGDHSPLKREDPSSVACPECGTGKGAVCSDQPMFGEGWSQYHRARRAAAAVVAPAYDTGTVIGHEPHPYPGYPRRHMLQLDNGSVVHVDASDLTAL